MTDYTNYMFDNLAEVKGKRIGVVSFYTKKANLELFLGDRRQST